jgi:hypothetical protein
MPYAQFRRQPVPQQYAQSLQTITLPAPTRGLIQSENEAYMQPFGAVVMDNWAPTLRGCKLRGGTALYCDLHALDTPVPPRPDPSRQEVVSAFEYVGGNGIQKMFAAQKTKLFEITTGTPVLVKGGQASGNYAAAQLSNMAGDHMLVVNDVGDYPLYFDGTAWTTYDAGQITGPAGGPAAVANGAGLTYVWTYRNRLFFVEGGTMNAYCLGTNSIQGQLQLIPLGGATTRGGSLLFGATWSMDTGSGIDDRCVFVTTLGELLIFTGNNPADPANWSQQGRYAIGRPMGMNAHMPLGGDLLIATVDGIVPTSQAISKDSGSLDLAMLTRTIRDMWRREVQAKSNRPWSMKRWDIYGGIFVTWPGGLPGNRYCAAMNNATSAWCRFTGSYDALCFVRKDDSMFFGTQDGTIMQMESGGYDDGKPYNATLVGGWEMFGAPSNTNVWHQARAVFAAAAGQPFEPALNCTVDYQIVIPPAPPPGPDPALQDVWDQGLWDAAKWDQASAVKPPVRNTMWKSIGKTGFAHAPIVQVTIAQHALPDVELLAIAATFERSGVNV